MMMATSGMATPMPILAPEDKSELPVVELVVLLEDCDADDVGIEVEETEDKVESVDCVALEVDDWNTAVSPKKYRAIAVSVAPYATRIGLPRHGRLEPKGIVTGVAGSVERVRDEV